MKIALFFVYTGDMAVSMEDIGFSMISAVMREKGHEVKEIFSNESNIDYDDIIQYKPDIIAFSVYTMSKEAAYRVIDLLVKKLPDVKVIMGGVHATSNDIHVLEENSHIDFAVRGEGEVTIAELLACIEKIGDYHSIKGLTFRENGRIYQNEDRKPIQNLDKLPYASRETLKQNNLQVALISTSRGCNSRCSFCSSQLFWKKWRGRSIQNCLNEIEHIYYKYNVSIFNFIDSSFEDPYIDLRRVKEIAQGILDRNLHISYFIDARAEIHRKLDHETMLLLKESGLIAACIGIEAGNEQDLKLYNKIANIEDNHKVIQLFRSYDISISPGFINFNPYSNLNKLQQNIDFLKKYDNSIRFFSFLSAYKGTSLYNKIRDDGLLLSENEEDHTFGYRFIDETAMKLAQYFYKYKFELNSDKIQYFSQMDFYYEIFPHMLGYYKRELSVYQNAEAMEFLKNCQDHYNEIRKSFDICCAKWIDSILTSATDKYDEKLFNQLKDKYMHENFFKSTVEQFNNNKNTLYLQLSRLGYWQMLKNF
ncbi:MAG: radical SAM protein [Bacteroidales bacterium]|jgi:radical SAM superfamily enzyme YgiQ (UPF0313 family)|nr:radical SAM protein [Clostridia bacterium]MDD2812622.1 radical SAM protein [Bacteroidales bacterium]MDD3092592.1 radical SAM protein [Clostridia bacterium]MDD3970582.1 radical SAM protein [Clostridia bacterium]